MKIIDVGTTNKTYIKDYEDNVSSKTAAILKVHKSNYKIKGFISEVSIKNSFNKVSSGAQALLPFSRLIALSTSL